MFPCGNRKDTTALTFMISPRCYCTAHLFTSKQVRDDSNGLPIVHHEKYVCVIFRPTTDFQWECSPGFYNLYYKTKLSQNSNLLLYDAGVDPHWEDELGRLSLTDHVLRRCTSSSSALQTSVACISSCDSVENPYSSCREKVAGSHQYLKGYAFCIQENGCCQATVEAWRA
uniref:Uncharacterized protein n=1 Tax=Nothobranchius rachovii TaxID=451742 RepID=A0A1A8P1K2_9TELE